MKSLIQKLDLKSYIDDFKSFFSREKEIYIEGDSNLHLRYIQKISKVDFNPPPKIKDLSTTLSYIKKSGHLKLYEIFEFVKIVRYFNYLKKIGFDDEIRGYLQKIVIEDQIQEISLSFDDKGELLESIDERFGIINQKLSNTKEQIKSKIKNIIREKRLSSYLVDTQIHYIDNSETLLLRGGFSQVIKGSVLGRSSGGFFYLHPKAISDLKEKESQLKSQRDDLIYEYEKRFSKLFQKYERFFSFINREFDRFDHYQARINFAKAKDLEFVKSQNQSSIILKNFSHPAIKDPKPISVEFNKKVLMITGVNAGGKTMLLKSILSAVFLAKYLLPMKIDANNSKISNFKEIEAIIDDPQSVKSDISTFAGRIREFSKLFSKNNFIVGVDEIELGTDANEAAALFRVILEELIKKECKIIITTHHKQLASMMSSFEEVELLAAIYDEKRELPTYQFLKGSVGKSYAFETAKRYGIPTYIINKTKELYGKEEESLGVLIQKNIDLELSLRERLKGIEQNELEVERLKNSLKDQKEKEIQKLKDLQNKMELSYKKAVDAAKEAVKKSSISDIHKQLNSSSKLIKEARESFKPNREKEVLEFKKGDFVKYRNQRGKILSVKKDEAFIESDGFKLRVPLRELKHSQNLPKTKQKIKIDHKKPSSSSVQIDLHGLRSDEAVERVDIFLSNALITGYDEVLIYHGVGTGKLAYAIREFLKSHPKVISFSDAPANMGGMGATLVRL